MTIDLYYDGDYQDSYNSVDAVVLAVKWDYDDYLAHAETDNSEGFPFELYTITQPVDIDLEKILTTNKRGSFPHSYRGEGNNDIG